MKENKLLFGLICILCFLHCRNLQAQSMGFAFPKGKEKQVIPFKTYNNLTVIPVKINNAITVDFILDTSIEHTIITEKAIGDKANLNYIKSISMGGSPDNPAKAYIASNVKLELTGGLISEFGQLALVMEQDYFNLRGTTGADIYGIIGYDIFKRFVVGINNTTSTLTLYEPKKFEALKSYEKVPLKIIGTKPFINTKVTFENWDKSNLDLMIDIGANHAILFSGDSSSFYIPTQNLEVTIAKSFEGEIKGYVGRVREISFGNFLFEEPVASFSGTDDMYLINEAYNDKKGAIGQDILTRFDYILDFHKKEFHLKKNNAYKNKFDYDMSGISIARDGSKSDVYIISSITEDSPASATDLLVGDVIIDLNGQKITDENFHKVVSTLRSKAGKSIIVNVSRNGKSLKSVFKLNKMI